MDAVFGAVKQNLDSMLGVPFVSSAVTLGLAFYAYKAGPELPSFVEELFLNVFFQVFVGFMVLYMTTGNVMLSLVVSVVFIYGMKMLSGLKEGMFGGDADSYITFMNSDFSDKLAEKLQKNESSLMKNVNMDNAKKILGLMQEVMNENNYGDLPEIKQEKADELNIPNKIQVA